jgi:DNA modification methylase
VESIAESLAAHGQYRPVVANKRTGEVLAGNHTLQAAQSLGWTELAVTWVDVDPEAAARIVLVDNRTSDLGTYDNDILAEVLSALPDLVGTGYVDAQLDALLADEEPVALTDPDLAPAVREDAPTRCQVGQVWQLGPHRLAVGDSTDQALSARLFADDGQLDLFLTDPPYGVSYASTDGKKVANDELRDGQLKALLLDAFRIAADRLRPGGPFYIFGPSNAQQTMFRLALMETSLQLRAELVWVKNSLVLGHSDYQLRHESVLVGHGGVEPETPPLEHDVFFYGWKDGGPHPWHGGRKQTSVLEYARPRSSLEHPTMKPVAMLEQLIRNSTDEGNLIYDAFGGSGSTLIAGYSTKRVVRMVELWPKYADVICRRFQDHTGIVPVCDGVRVDFSGAQP